MAYFRLKTRRHPVKKYKYNLKAKVLKLAKIVRRNKPEVKYGDLAISGQAFNYTPTSSYVINMFSSFSQGNTDNSSYQGDEIFVKNVKIQFSFYNTTTSYQLYRLIMVQVLRNSEGLITTSNLGNLFMESAYSVSANAVNAPLDNDNRHGFKVLWDKRFIMNPALSSATASNQALMFKKTLIINKPVSFMAGGTIPAKNGLYLLCISDAAASGYMNFVSRMHYTDV